jgi:histidinol-phosphate aminotransferase
MSAKIPQSKKHLDGLVRMNFEPGSRLSYLRLDMNESPVGLPEKLVREALSHIDANFLSTYPTYPEFEKKLARSLKIKPDRLCIANGSDAAIKYIFDAYVNPGDRVLLTNPSRFPIMTT